MGVLVVPVDPVDVDACSDWLWQLGAQAIEERPATDDRVALVVGFVDDDAALAARSVLSERWPGRLEDTGDERDWRDRWLTHLEPIEVAGLWIHAPWHDPAHAPADLVPVSIDPGRAFGSGHHPTTQLAIEQLANSLEPGETVLDAGCGTGILSIAALEFGAKRVTGVDLDHDILAVADANAVANGVAGRIELTEASLLDMTASFDVVVANIVIGDLRPLMPFLVGRARRAVIVSGFLDEQFDSLIVDLDVRVAERTEREGWGCALLTIPQ